MSPGEAAVCDSAGTAFPIGSCACRASRQGAVSAMDRGACSEVHHLFVTDSYARGRVTVKRVPWRARSGR